MVGFTKYIDIIYDDGSTKEGGGNGAILRQSFYFLLELRSIKVDCNKMRNVNHRATTRKLWLRNRWLKNQKH